MQSRDFEKLRRANEHKLPERYHEDVLSVPLFLILKNKIATEFNIRNQDDASPKFFWRLKIPKLMMKIVITRFDMTETVLMKLSH